MNKVILIGRIVAEPDLRATTSGKSVASYRLAVDRAVKQEGQPTADFINCVAWGRNAEFASAFLHKGMKIAVEGSIQTGSYEKDGVKHYTTDIIVDELEFLETRAEAQRGRAEDVGAFFGAPPEIADDPDSELPF